MALISIRPEELGRNAFDLFRADLPLLTAAHEGRVNTMTIGWGQLGVVWGRCTATVYVRPQRFTFPLVEAADGFSLCVLGPDRKADVAYCGKVSGRDEDKIAHCGLTVAYRGGIPYFEEAETVLLCRKLYADWLEAPHFLAEALCGQWYPEKDYHRAYTAEILDVLVKK